MAARNDKKINCCNGNTKYCERNSAMTSDLSATGNFHKISTFANVCEGRKMGHIVYHMCIAAVLFVGGTYASQPSETQQSDMQTIPLLWSLSPAYLQSLRVGMDQETLNYLLPRLSAKYKPNNSWSDIADPRFYVLSELGPQEYDKQDSSNIMPKRNSLRSNGHTLSIVQPLDVLRQRMLLEIARRKVLEQAQKVEENRAYLKTIGKRSVDRQSLHQYQSL